MVTPGKSSAFGLLILAALSLPAERTPGHSQAAIAERTARLEAARARTERLERRHLQCEAERESLEAAVASRRVACESEFAAFQQCRADRPDLEGAELWGCGLGLAMGVASRLAAEPWKLSECGLAEAPESRVSCHVPACSLEPEEIEREVLAARGLSSMPVCDDPSA